MRTRPARCKTAFLKSKDHSRNSPASSVFRSVRLTAPRPASRANPPADPSLRRKPRLRAPIPIRAFNGPELSVCYRPRSLNPTRRRAVECVTTRLDRPSCCSWPSARWMGFLFRWQLNRAIAEKAEKAAAAKRTQDQQTFQAMGGNSFEILAFSRIPRPSAAVIQPRSVTAYPTPKASPSNRRRTCAYGPPTNAASASRPPKPPPTPSPPPTPPPTPSPPKPPSKSTDFSEESLFDVH